ncbi:MAG: efflux RND transporter periplasmic adaptor subunit [Vicinamibacteria bacterium]|nr:efflux RND transporter periplasmic adaptor subunit [Vicinamibacteria bacterium]
MSKKRVAIVIMSLAPLVVGCGREKSVPRPAAAALATPVVPPAAATPEPKAASSTSSAALTANGEFVSPVHSELAARVTGRVARVVADVGDRVKKGQVLLELEKEYFELDLRRAEADLARADAAARDAARDLERKRALREKDSVSKAMFERIESVAQQAQAGRAAAEANLATARQRLNDAVLVSPIDGVVMERRTDVGESLGTNTVTFVLVQIAPLKLRFRLPEDALAAARPGRAVHAHVAPYPDQSFDGRITAIVPVIDPATRSFLVEAEFANADGRLRPGLFARVDLPAAAQAR